MIGDELAYIIIVVAVTFIIELIVYAWVKLMDEVPKEYEECYGCQSGWCDCYPGDEECRKWRSKIEQTLREK